MDSEQHSRNHLTILIKYGVLICIFALLGSTTACSSLPFKIVPNTQEGEPPPEEHWEEGEPPPEGPPPGEEFHGEEPMPGEPPPEGSPPGEEFHGEEPMPGEPPPPEPEPPQPEPQQQPPPQGNPPAPAPNQCQSNFETDIAVTDLYAGNLPNGQVHVRITNHGPCTLQNVKDEVYCFVDQTNHSTNKVSYDSKTVKVVYDMAPGTQQTFPTGITLDTNVFNYEVTCNLQPGNFHELNPGNNSHTEKIP